MTFEIEINNKPVKVKKGETILEVLNRIGIKVPTLCSMKNFIPTGMCRMCVVELEGKNMLIPSCSFKVEEWMKIKTHTPRVVLARKTIVELLLANHPDDCLYCERNGNCELQTLAEELHVRERRITGEKDKQQIDKSSIAIIHDPSKCILCGRCIRVCNEKIGVSTFEFSHRGIKTSVETALNKPINSSPCIVCGQCIITCPTAALSERVNFSEFQVQFHDPRKKMVALYSPAIASTLAMEYNLKPTRDINAILQTILRKIGFEIVFDTSMATDIMIMELCGDFIERLKTNGKLPMFTSCCPSWVKYVEQTFPDLIGNLTSSKSYQQLSGVLAKTYLANRLNISPENLFLVSIEPCTSRKYESSRPEMTSMGISEIDSVITTREFFRMIKMYGIDVNSIEPDNQPLQFPFTSQAGKLVNLSGGTTFAFLKTLNMLLTGKELDLNRINIYPSNKPIKEFKIEIGPYQLGIAIVNGLRNIKPLLGELHEGRNDIHFIEVMTCENGCIAGGGQPIKNMEFEIKNRIKFLNEWINKDEPYEIPHNKHLKELYENYFHAQFPSKYFEKFHTQFFQKDVIN